MSDAQLKLPNFLVIGAYSRNAGKTTFSRNVIKRIGTKIIALKITVIDSETKGCPRGGIGCGVCTSLDLDYEISEEKDINGSKDTSKLLRSGAEKVLWLRVKDFAVMEGLNALLRELDSSVPVICESNRVMKFIDPGLYLLLKAKDERKLKKNALSVEDKADLIIETTPEGADFQFEKLSFYSGLWQLKN